MSAVIVLLVKWKTTPSFRIPLECLCSGEDPATIWSCLSSQSLVEILFDIVPGAKLGNTKIYSSSRSISNGFMDILLELEAIYIFSRNAVEPLSELDRSVLLIADGIKTNCELGSLNKFGANGNHSRDPNVNFCHSGTPRWMEEGKGGRIELERTKQLSVCTCFPQHWHLSAYGRTHVVLMDPTR